MGGSPGSAVRLTNMLGSGCFLVGCVWFGLVGMNEGASKQAKHRQAYKSMQKCTAKEKKSVCRN